MSNIRYTNAHRLKALKKLKGGPRLGGCARTASHPASGGVPGQAAQRISDTGALHT